jgi:hypothetical protein
MKTAIGLVITTPLVFIDFYIIHIVAIVSDVSSVSTTIIVLVINTVVMAWP